MEYNYTINPEDLYYLGDLFSDDNEDIIKFKSNLKLFPGLILFPITIFLIIRGSNISYYFGIFSILFCGVWYKSSDKIYKYLTVKQFKNFLNKAENKWMTKPRTMILGENRLKETVEYQITKSGIEDKIILDIDYKDLKKLISNEQGIYIFVSDYSSYIMPSRCFKNKEEQNLVYEYIKDKRDL